MWLCGVWPRGRAVFAMSTRYWNGGQRCVVGAAFIIQLEWTIARFYIDTITQAPYNISSRTLSCCTNIVRRCTAGFIQRRWRRQRAMYNLLRNTEPQDSANRSPRSPPSPGRLLLAGWLASVGFIHAFPMASPHTTRRHALHWALMGCWPPHWVSYRVVCVSYKGDDDKYALCSMWVREYL